MRFYAYRKIHFLYMLAIVACLVVDYFFPGNRDVLIAMQIIPAITTGPGVATNYGPSPTMENHILIGDIDTAMPLNGFKLVVDGETKIDISNSIPLMSVFSKLMQRLAGAVVGLLLKIGTGRLNAKNIQISLINGGATTPAVYAYSDRDPGKAVTTKQATINANTPQVFDDFTFLCAVSANLLSADITWKDGSFQNMTAVELDSLFARDNDCEANGRLDATITTLDNRDGKFRSVKLNAGAAALVVLPIKYN